MYGVVCFCECGFVFEDLWWCIVFGIFENVCVVLCFDDVGCDDDDFVFCVVIVVYEVDLVVEFVGV